MGSLGSGSTKIVGTKFSSGMAAADCDCSGAGLETGWGAGVAASFAASAKRAWRRTRIESSPAAAPAPAAAGARTAWVVEAEAIENDEGLEPKMKTATPSKSRLAEKSRMIVF